MTTMNVTIKGEVYRVSYVCRATVQGKMQRFLRGVSRTGKSFVLEVTK